MRSLPPLSLHLVTSRQRLAPDARTPAQALLALESQIDEAIAAGVDVVQVRERDLDARVLWAFVARLVARAGGSATRVIVNDRLDVALAAGAAGVHLPAAGLAADRVRVLAADLLVGRSIHVGDMPADRAACDYLYFGTVFPSESKGPGRPAAGLVALVDTVARVARPVVAIGGVTPERVTSCLDAGAVGIAAISAFLPPGRAHDALGPRQAVAEFRARLQAP